MYEMKYTQLAKTHYSSQKVSYKENLESRTQLLQAEYYTGKKRPKNK